MDDLEFTFVNCTEIRMGSPFMSCDLSVKGSWRPALPGGDWLPITARSDDGRFLGLARWKTSGNESGFQIYTIDSELHKIDVSEREFGLCENLRWSGGKFLANRRVANQDRPPRPTRRTCK